MRRLIYHPESDCLFEVNSDQEFEQTMNFGDGMLTEVTGEEKYEAQFECINIHPYCSVCDSCSICTANDCICSLKDDE